MGEYVLLLMIWGLYYIDEGWAIRYDYKFIYSQKDTDN